MIYLDNAATSLPKPKSVEQAVVRSLRYYAGYNRGGHASAMQAAEAVFACRQEAAEFFNVPGPEYVVFCQNATHALNIAIFGLMPEKGRVIISGYEHNAVLRPVAACKNGYTAVKTPLFDKEAVVSGFEKELQKGDVGLVVCTMVSNVFGFALPAKEIGALCEKYGVPYVVDASQAAGALPVDAEKLKADAVCLPGHKGLLGPSGTGLLLLSGKNLPRPLLFGGTGIESRPVTMPDLPPERYEAGTQNLVGIAGLLEGIRFVSKNQREIWEHEKKLAARLVGHLSGMPNVEVFAPKTGPETGVVSFRSPLIDCESWNDRLSAKGFALRAGLHCAPLAHQTAGTLETGTLRASPGPFNTERHIDRLAEALFDTLTE